jgi:hypothetical protein
MKAVITKSQFDRIKNFINETKEIKKEDVLDEKKKLSKKQLKAFDVDNDGDIEGDDLADLRAMKKITKSKRKTKKKLHEKEYTSAQLKAFDKNKNGIPFEPKDWEMMDEGSDCGCGEDKDDTRYMFFSNLEQMMRQAKMLLQMDEDMLEDLLNNGHDWAADHIAEAKNNMDQVFDFIMNEMNGEGEDDDWDNEDEDDEDEDDEDEDMMYEEDDTLGTPEDVKGFVKLGQKKPQGMSTPDYEKYLQDKEKAMSLKSDLFKNQPSINEGMRLKKKAFVSKELKNHLDNKISLSESEFRSGSPKHIELLKEVKELYNKGLIKLNETDEFIVNEFDPKPIKVKGVGEVYLGLILEEYESDEQLLSEAVYQGRKVQLGKPFLTPDGPKKRSVYVRNDKGNVVKVNFGDPNMRIKKNIPSHRKSFRARHKCETANDKTSARYWSCKAW